jgi:dipeptidyl aminopeptidase/acylaminoacyl peptidase
MRITTSRAGPYATELGGKTPTDWSPDGYVLYTSMNDVWAVRPAKDGASEPLQVTNTAFTETNARFSPDGRWIAYQSTDSPNGQDVYVQSFPDARHRYAISVGGGSVPRWARRDTELYYIGPGAMLMAVSIRHTGDELEIGKPVRLFQSRALESDREYDVGPDGRFLINLPVEEKTGDSLTVVLNWAAQLPK